LSPRESASLTLSQLSAVPYKSLSLSPPSGRTESTRSAAFADREVSLSSARRDSFETFSVASLGVELRRGCCQSTGEATQCRSVVKENSACCLRTDVLHIRDHIANPSRLTKNAAPKDVSENVGRYHAFLPADSLAESQPATIRSDSEPSSSPC